VRVLKEGYTIGVGAVWKTGQGGHIFAGALPLISVLIWLWGKL
jgi:hypothetical protein